MSLRKLLRFACLLCFIVPVTTSGLLDAQSVDDGNSMVKRVIRVHHLNPNDVSGMFRKWVRGNMIPSKDLGVLTVIGTASEVDTVEEAIRALDVPRAPDADINVELTVHFLGVTDEPTTARLPGDLNAVVEQLKPRFPYPGYELLDTLITRVRVDRATEVSGVEPDPSGQRSVRPMIYQFRTNVTGVSGAVGARTVHLQNLRAGFRVPILTGEDEYNYSDLGINTDIDIAENKLVVIGKTGMQGKARGMFVILQARVDE